MNNRPVIDRELLIPILLGGFSVMGIIGVLLIGRALNSPAEVTATPSATAFRYVYLGTEPAVTTLVVDSSELPPTGEPAVTEPSADSFPPPVILPSSTPGGVVFPFVSRTPSAGAARTSTPSRAPTATRTSTPSAANTYDDTDTRLQYSGSWISQTGLPTSGSGGAYNGTLHISDVADGTRSVKIQFSGTEIYFYYQPASSFGVVAIYLDNDPLEYTRLSEAQGGVWHYVFEESKAHVVEIKHVSGGSVNVDKLVIPVATPTPTRTPTP
jgi:hypothetical protein